MLYANNKGTDQPAQPFHDNLFIAYANNKGAAEPAVWSAPLLFPA